MSEIPDAQIEYGISKVALDHIVRVLADAARQFTQTALAHRAGITRQELIAILNGTSKPRARTVRALMNALRYVSSTDNGV